MSTKAINNLCINIFVCTRRIETFHFYCGLTHWKYDMAMFSDLLVLFRRGLSLPDSESSSHLVYRPVGVAWNIERIKLTSVNSDNGLAAICRNPDESFVHNSFPCKYYGWSSNHVFTCLIQLLLVALCEGLELCSSWPVKTNICKIWQSTSKLKHVNSFIVVKVVHLLHSF